MRHPRKHCEAHLKFIRTLPCVVCGDNISSEAAHIRFSDDRSAKRNVGMGEKPDDLWVLPMCGRHHREQHSQREQNFWNQHRIDPIFTALALWSATGDPERGEHIISRARIDFTTPVYAGRER